MATGGGLSKQKSCNACVRSKRRCDKRTPACSNCTKKRYLCVYGSRLQMNSSANSADVPRSVDSFGDSLSTHCDSLMLDDGGSSADFDVNLGLSPSTILQIDSAFDSLLNSTFETAYDQTPGQTEFLRQGINIASSTSTSKILSLQDYSKLLPMCVSYRKRDCLLFCLILTTAGGLRAMATRRPVKHCRLWDECLQELPCLVLPR